MIHARTLAAALAVALSVTAWASAARQPQRDLAYGPHDAQRLDLYPAPDASPAHPAPALVYFHGGGFRSGDKGTLSTRLIDTLNKAGVSVASVNYRFFTDAPLPAAMRDGARAMQFLRAHAADYSLDPERVAVMGSSAGAGIALWIAYHDDLADPRSDDPVRRESTRVRTAYVKGAQVSYDPAFWEQLGLGKVLAGYALPELFGTSDPDELARRIAEASPITHVSAGDPPVRCDYSASMAITDETPGTDLLHHPAHGVALREACEAAGVACAVYYPGGDEADQSASAYLIAALRAQAGTPGGVDPEAPLAGPEVDDDASRTIVQRGMGGRMDTPETWPEFSAVAQLDIDQATREKVRAIADERARAVAMALVDNLDLFAEISDATEAGDRDKARELTDTLWGRIDPKRSRSPALGELSSLLTPAQADELTRMVDAYWEAALDQRLGKRGDRDKPSTRRSVMHRLALDRFTREVRRAYDASLRRYREAIDAVSRAVDPTEAQRAEIRRIVIEHIKRTRLEATPEQRREAMLEIYRSLDESRRERLFVYMTRAALPDGA